eukprot:CAMPEP_0184022664 /NCGR_PEP_ID=MMETSP0954-20121128/10769_1 /TAXON_ID=627963 /ORGANISM="Aplanochytrium sp, Strain PBS07" /LENGTH=666 /DNA_ID=CAMNT_0026305139 /DNA_START=46 /DNA_END=2046 /DNA_ORIENTATION=-
MTGKRKHRGSGAGDTILTKRIYSAIEDTDIKTSERVLEKLLQRHAEYNRKNRQALLRTISGLLSSQEVSERKDQKNGENGGESAKVVETPKPRRKLRRKRPAGSFVTGKLSSVRYSDLGGIEQILPTIKENIEWPILHREVYQHIGVDPPKGVLLRGPPGCGKTMLAHAIAGELQVPFYNLSAPEIVSGMSGESEEKIRRLFSDARENAPAIIFIDEIDAITGKRENSSRGMEKRIVAQLLTSMNDIKTSDLSDKEEEENDDSNSKGLDSAGVLVIGATNRPDALDPALRRAGRFDREISMGIPDKNSRISILTALTTRMRLSGDFNFDEIAQITPGFVGADLSSVCKEAAAEAINRVFKTRGSNNTSCNVDRLPFSSEELENVFVTMNDFRSAIGKVQPSSKREGFTTVPEITWDDVGALEDVREELRMAIVEPIANPEKFERFGLNTHGGVLLYGPPGCGKTLVAKAVANCSGANFISVKGPELLNKYVGESEKAVRQVFERARASSPCVVFFDELDSLCPKRSISGESGGVSERVVNQLLTEMDGVGNRKHVYVLAATNRRDIIDEAMLRPGRLDKHLYISLPSADDRLKILLTRIRKTPVSKNVDLGLISQRLEGYSGADIDSLVKSAAVIALRNGKTEVEMNDFENAIGKVKPSVMNADSY